MSPIKVILADAHTLFCESVLALLAPEETLHICAMAPDGGALLGAVERHRPGVVLTEADLPGLSGAEATRALKKIYPETAVLGFSWLEHTHTVRGLVDAGASGYIYKSTATRQELLEAIHTVHEGRFYFSRLLSSRLTRILGGEQMNAYPTTGEPLTEKDLQIMRLICCQLSSKQIAPQVGLTPRSVEAYRDKLMEKIGAENVVGIALYAVRHGIFKI